MAHLDPPSPRVESLTVHPVKSTAGRPVAEAHVEGGGLRDDRRWMVVDSAGEAVTARTTRHLLRVVADTAATVAGIPDGVLRLSLHPAAPDPAGGLPRTIDLAQPTDGAEAVTIFGRPLTGRAAGPDADVWVRAVLGRDDIRLMHCHEPTARRLNPTYARPTDWAHYQDGSPVTLVSSESVQQVRDWARAVHGSDADAVVAGRFRANILVAGVAAAFAEDDWRACTIGEVPFRVAERVVRCGLTLIDPDTLERGKEPIRTLGAHRRSDAGVVLAVKLLPDGEGTIRVGDPVTPG